LSLGPFFSGGRFLKGHSWKGVGGESVYLWYTDNPIKMRSQGGIQGLSYGGVRSPPSTLGKKEKKRGAKSQLGQPYPPSHRELFNQAAQQKPKSSKKKEKENLEEKPLNFRGDHREKKVGGMS